MGIAEALRRQDLKPGQEVVLVEHLGRFARSVTRQAAASGRLTVFMRGIHGVRQAAWFQDAVERGHLREFCVHPFGALDEFWRADDKAFDAVEAVYAVMKQRGKVPAAPLVELYGDAEIEAAFKKHLLRRLTDFYETLTAIKLLGMESLSVEFYPSEAWRQIGAWLDLAGMRWKLPEGARVVFGLWARLMRAESGLERLKWWSILALLPVWVLRGVRRVVWSQSSPQFVQVGIRVYTTDWGFPGENPREIDWLLDGRQVHRDNTLFVIEKPLSAEYREEFERRRYRCVDVSGRNAFRRLSRRFLFGELLGRGLKAWARLLIAVTRGRWFFLEVAVRGWLDYLRWTAFLEQWRPRHYVAYNHGHFDHLFRNSRLRSVGCASWYYVLSPHDRGAFYDGLPGRAIRSHGWAYLGYDHEVHWGRRDEEWYRQMHGKARAYHTWGPLWSALVKPLPSVTALINQRRSTQKIDAIVAVFDTSFGPASPYGETGARDFYDDLVAMLDEPRWASRLLLFKPKNSLNELRSQALPDVAASLDRLLTHPRCLSRGADLASSAVIAEADLTVSIAYSSTTVDALGARRRAIYFDPGGKFRHSYYDRFPNLVAHDRKALAQLCEHWLQMPEAEFQKYLDDYLAPEFGGHMDASAMERFRSALSANGFGGVKDGAEPGRVRGNAECDSTRIA